MPTNPKTTITVKEGKEYKPVILQVVPELDVPGGTERSTIEISRALSAAGWKSIVVSSGGSMLHQTKSEDARHIIMPVKDKNPIQLAINANRLTKLIKTEGVDIIHARSRAPAWSARHAANSAGCHFLTTFHGAYNNTGKFKNLYNSIMTKGELVIANSNFTANHIIDHYSIEQERLRIIPRGVDVAIYNPNQVAPERIIQLTSKWRLPDGKLVILLPGRLTHWKGHSILLDAIAYLKRDDFVVVFIGDEQGRENYRLRLEQQVEHNGLGSAVRFAGPCRDMPAAYMSSDIVVSPSIKPEAFGRVIIEGQAMGRPIVAFGHGGAEETIIDGETGFLVEPGNTLELSKAIRKALDLSAERRAEISKHAIHHINQNFTLEKMCNETLLVYKELIDRGKCE